MAKITDEVALGLRSTTRPLGCSRPEIQASHALEACTRYLETRYLRPTAFPGSCRSSEPAVFLLDLNNCKQNKSISPCLDPFLLTLST